MTNELDTKQIKQSGAPSDNWDVIVIGGGPAGMMAAGQAAKRGAKVLLIEKNDTLGKKLLITGGGRCNVTNAEFDNRKLLAKFADNGRFLHSTFAKWSVRETLNFFKLHNLETKIEALQRVFPITDKAQSVWDVLVNNIKQAGVTVMSNTPVIGFELDGKSIITGVKIGHSTTNRMLRARNFILATGGKSRPETGSTGDGFEWLKQISHTVIEPTASLVPISLKDPWIKRLQGVVLQGIKITPMQNSVKQGVGVIGRVLFTHFGISGPTVLNMSHDIGELLKYGEVELELDLLPDLDYGELNQRLQDLLKEHSNKKFKNSLGELVTPAMAPIIVELSGIDPGQWSHSVTREERLSLVKLIKHLTLHVKGLLGNDKAVVTSGGVALDEVDFRTMQSRLFSNLYLVGDILNIDRPSGGYSLQLCWTTGFVAGDSSAN